MSVDILIKGLDFPEGPAFDSKGNLWFVELKGGNLCQWADGVLKRFPTDGEPNGVAIDGNDHIWFCDAGQNAIRTYCPDSDSFETVENQIENRPLFRPNDLTFDVNGNLLFTCPGDSRTEPTGYVCALKMDGTVRKIAESLYFPNGLAFAPEGKTLIIAETYMHRLWKGTWDVQGFRLGNFEPWMVVGGPTGPDGMAFDVEGNLYVAIFGKQCIKKISPLGEIVKEIPLSGKNPTNCAFQGTSLFVTEAEVGQIMRLATPYLGLPLFSK
ncbi:SMP-30/gluconolactonase/LRE family protein [Ulvibacterium marinum]|nr:SMP-30/gluconolactonase/LRE family protein [Ulvibacterium marinum]